MKGHLANFPISYAALLLLALASGCENNVCGDYRAFFEDPRLEAVAGPVVAGREGAIFHISSKKEGLAPQIVVADSTTSEDILAVMPLDGDLVFVAGRAGTVLLSQDKGVTWSRPQLPANFRDDLHALTFGCPDLAAPYPGLAVGAEGSVLRSIDGRLSWNEAPTGRSSTLRSIAVLSPNEVVVVGDQGLILRSANFGETWSAVPSPSSDDLIRVIAEAPSCLVPAENSMFADFMFAAGRLGDLLISRDRGETWEIFAEFPNGPIVDFFPFADLAPSAPGTELLGATVVSSRTFWDFDDAGALIQRMEFPADITSVDPSWRFVVAGGALYHRHFDPECQ